MECIIIPHRWCIVEQYINTLYVRQLNDNGSVYYRILTIPTQRHIGQTLAASIKSQLQSAFGSGMYNAYYNGRTVAITITKATANVAFMFYWWRFGSKCGLARCHTRHSQVKAHDWCVKKPRHNYGGFSIRTWLLDLLNVHNRYTRSNIGGCITVGPRGEHTIINTYQLQLTMYMILIVVLSPHNITLMYHHR